MESPVASEDDRKEAFLADLPSYLSTDYIKEYIRDRRLSTDSSVDSDSGYEFEPEALTSEFFLCQFAPWYLYV